MSDIPFEEEVQVIMQLMRSRLRERGLTTSPENLRAMAEDFARKNPGGIERVTDPEKIAELNEIAFGEKK